ncbi:PREDICTED: pyroglutamyl-peptidase 1-like protein isoform X2 [Gavialis gangeticus]|uniref:pyroglutamyl-peptidase 1-like protein isoform X2 n=1 Tax=Gavialis gangeticus TaxID=94835 RepID=UPI00092EBA14|nr:PREDICTED: pyroglutamyl-peptidase 1-like protein isoform X2 [Gavialis gangeticus]
MDSNSNTVVVTGFGPFRQYLVNSSWEAVKELSKMGLGSDIDLQIVQLPVSYQKTKELVWKIWTTLQPLLTVHIGLASSSKAIIILEQCGKNKGYKEKDVCGYCPQDGCCLLDGPERIDSTIDMKTLWKTVAVEGIDILFSRDAGGNALAEEIPWKGQVTLCAFEEKAAVLSKERRQHHFCSDAVYLHLQ